jgi:hypothetical protein
MENVSQLQTSPHHFLKHFLGDKYIAIGYDEGSSRIITGDLTTMELAYLVSILQMFCEDQIRLSGE